MLTVCATTSISAGAVPRGDVLHADPGGLGEQDAGHMVVAAHPAGGEGEVAPGARLRQRDQLLQRVHAEVRVHHQHVLVGGDLRDRGKRGGEVHLVAALQVRVDHDVGADGEEQHQPVRPRPCHRERAHVASGAAAVVDHHSLTTELLGKERRELARDDVGAAAGGVGHHQRDGPLLLRGRRPDADNGSHGG
jgi:hypothetical protein